MLLTVFVPFLSVLGLTSAHVKSSVPSGVCDSQCNTWYSKTNDHSICVFLRDNFDSYTSCGQCNIGGAEDQQQYWANQWNAEINFWYSQCPSEYGINIQDAYFDSDGSFQVGIPDTSGVTTVTVQSVVTIYGSPPSSTPFSSATGSPLSTAFVSPTSSGSGANSTATTTSGASNKGLSVLAALSLPLALLIV